MWDDRYRETKCYWGMKSDRIVVKYAGLAPKGKTLDIGVGEGRNAIFLAWEGFDVLGIDSSHEAISKCKELTKRGGISLKLEQKDIRRLTIQKHCYSIIISMWTLQFIKKDEIMRLIDEIKQGLLQNGIVCIGVFTVDDPGYQKMRQKYELVSHNTVYLSNSNTYIYFFDKNELRNIFKNFGILYYKERMYLDRAHNTPHYHGIAELVARKL